MRLYPDFWTVTARLGNRLAAARTGDVIVCTTPRVIGDGRRRMA